MKAVEARFIGNGNAWVADGHYRGWQARCSGCGAVKMVSGHNGSMLPPNVIAKKFVQAGWYLGRKASEDLCRSCRRKPRKPAAVNGSGRTPPAPPPADKPEDCVAFLRSCLDKAKVAAKARQHNRAAEYIDAALAGLAAVRLEPKPAPAPPRKKPPKPPPPPPETDAEYAEWLASLTKEPS